jgi:hypothetical protein
MPRVFLCYRRDDAESSVIALNARLTDRFGDEQIFRDRGSIELPGQDFARDIDQMVAACDVFLAVIGKHWLSTVDAQGRRRLDDPNDWVRLEIATAFRRGLRVITVLVDGTTMPRPENLPQPLILSLRPLFLSQLVRLTDERLREDTDHLLDILAQVGESRTWTQKDTPQETTEQDSRPGPALPPPPSPRGPIRVGDIFLSYAEEDRDKARLIAEALSRCGWPVWWDRRIPIGKSWDEVIEAALDAAKCVVVLWSRAAVTSNWTRNEAGEGLRRGILAPACLEDVLIPLGFRHIQAADLVHWTGDPDADGLRDLADAVANLMEPHEEN